MLEKIILKIIGLNGLMLLKSKFPSKQEKDLFLKRRNFYKQFLSKGSVYFDVGANFGNRIEPIIDLGIKVIAIEPQEECKKYLKKKFGNRITLIPFGLSSKEGEQTMFISNAHTISSFSKDWIDLTKESGRFSEYEWNKEKIIPMTTLDNLINDFGSANFIKIDVEGFELEVLKGLSSKIDFISFEYSVPENIDLVVGCIERINEVSVGEATFNYSVGESTEWGMEKWMTFEEIIKEIQSERFIKTDFGDLYSKTTHLTKN